MTQTTARIKKAGKDFEIMVDLDKALAFKKGEGTPGDFLEIDKVFTDAKKGEHASESDLKESFRTDDVYEIAGEIVKRGEILLTQEYRDEERDKKMRQIVDAIVSTAVDPQTGNPHTAERIKSALEQAHVQIKNVPIDSQIKDIVAQLSKVIPIKLETKRIKIVIPAIHTGKVYGVINPVKENEKWLDNGDLEVVASVPSGAQLFSFYDKINSLTHGSAITEEIKDE
ncbi:MAG: ribosome assembly factor SBDS [Nanoarchaeota archaeon]|nr:ribosome assembly factor SBDS [Nanoarchaeota archaeon]MBU1501654.1 ribosome assembly factor SBDS [Nanoarchaeota archaeon]MBU2458939.1 ribosome assembly factor SBDS [Nanoarchaeota archaeon]